MKRINLTKAAPSVKRFIRDIDLNGEGVELALDGQVVANLIPPNQLSDAEKDDLLKQGMAILRQTQVRNQGVPQREVARVVREAIRTVRGRK